MIEIVALSLNARRREALTGLTGYGSRMLSMPAATNTSALPSFAQQTPTAPRSICHRAMIGDLWVFAWGRRATPAASASCCAASMLRITRARSIRTCGVGRSASCMGRLYYDAIITSLAEVRLLTFSDNPIITRLAGLTRADAELSELIHGERRRVALQHARELLCERDGAKRR